MLAWIWGEKPHNFLLVGMLTGSTSSEYNIDMSEKLIIELSYNPASRFLCFYTRGPKLLFQNDTCNPMYIVALFTSTKIWKKSNCPRTAGRLTMIGKNPETIMKGIRNSDRGYRCWTARNLIINNIVDHWCFQLKKSQKL